MDANPFFRSSESAICAMHSRLRSESDAAFAFGISIYIILVIVSPFIIICEIEREGVERAESKSQETFA